MAEIRIESVTKAFDDTIAVSDANLVVEDREFLVLLGPSGCGKTTLLRAIAGLGMADSGRISIGGRDVTYLPPGKRNISMVFQSYAIFPHMTVRENIGFGLKMSKTAAGEIARRVDEAAELLHIEELLERRPGAMSGGQRQRVAVARALAMEAEVLLMDEPLSNLDALLRLEMRAELKRLLAEVNATTVYVTHDQIEALSMGDRVAVMREGELQQLDVPSTVYESPSNRFVGSFIGNPPMNFLDGAIHRDTQGLRVEVGDHSIDPGAAIEPVLAGIPGDRVVLGIRAENMEAVPHAGPDTVPVMVDVVEPLGSQNLLTVSMAGHRLKVSTHPTFPIKADEQLHIRFPADQIRWIDPATDLVLAG
ncbi:MAG: ABC transporter ATP-binding protein [Acidimicrobiales bacterium]